MVGLLAAATIGGFVVNAPLFGLVAGGLGAVAILRRWCSLPRFWDLEPGTPAATLAEQHQHVLTLGADGLQVTGMFHPWIGVQEVSVQEDHLRVNFCDGREWYLRASAPQRIAEDAWRRIRWAHNAKTQASHVGYRASARGRYCESQGLPTSLRVGEDMERRIEDYRVLDEHTKAKVQASMVDSRTRFRFARSDLGCEF